MTDDSSYFSSLAAKMRLNAPEHLQRSKYISDDIINKIKFNVSNIPEITERLYSFRFFVIGAVIHLDGSVMVRCKRFDDLDTPLCYLTRLALLLSASAGSLADGPGSTRTSATLVGSVSQLTSGEIARVPSDWLRGPDAACSVDRKLNSHATCPETQQFTFMFITVSIVMMIFFAHHV